MSQRPYRPADLYSVQCDCGAEIESATKEAVCGACGAVVRMEWPCVAVRA